MTPRDAAAAHLPANWSPESWRHLPADQQPDWPDQAALEAVIDELRGLPPLVFAGEARNLTRSLADVSEGRAFLLQAGDCAESFDGFSANEIRDKLKVILQMAVVFTYSTGVPTVKVGRIAGQFAKPRSTPTEARDGVELPSFRGHMVNAIDFEGAARAADPQRLLRAYNQSAATLNLLRAFTKGGFADLSQVHAWNLEFSQTSPEGRRYEVIADEIERALRFMAACGIDLATEPQLHEVDFYTSHEALVLGYEEALTRVDSLTGDWYDCSAHMLWIGERTRQLDGAHVHFLSGVKNPVGCKLGPSATPDEAVALCEALNPDRTAGRVTLISRMGATAVQETLPPIVEAVRSAGHPVVWACDPMHGNTFTSQAGFKTRRLADIMGELEGYFAVHRSLGTWPGGIHIELTGTDVTECLGGSDEVRDDQLEHRYETMCDPRLNARQSLDLAFDTAEMLRALPRHGREHA
ncbi:MAG: 3-deoxy-7-phosphoheptulonate synthase class II [Actinobacteria bacterium]|nr:3-deoxy-7-phosphoheptulonate synthase class II [Actinomycetota bacterium]